MYIEKLTFKLSVYIQLLGIILIPLGFLVPKKKDKLSLYNCLQLESIVNIIELISYIIIGFYIYKISDISFMRYYDWFITTPLLLLSVIIYFQYLKGQYKTTYKNILFQKNNRNIYIKIIIYNFLMLLMGFLGEINIIPKLYTTIIGFIFFILLFKELYKFAEKDNKSKEFFIYFMLLWSLYGVSYMFKSPIKNTGYNILDLFSKTFYGLMILYKYLK